MHRKVFTPMMLKDNTNMKVNPWCKPLFFQRLVDIYFTKQMWHIGRRCMSKCHILKCVQIISNDNLKLFAEDNHRTPRFHGVRWWGRGETCILPGGLCFEPAPLDLAPCLSQRGTHVYHGKQVSQGWAVLLHASADPRQVSTESFKSLNTSTLLYLYRCKLIQFKSYRIHFTEGKLLLTELFSNGLIWIESLLIAITLVTGGVILYNIICVTDEVLTETVRNMVCCKGHFMVLGV